DQGVTHGAERVTLADAGQPERQDIGGGGEKRPGGELLQPVHDRRGQPPRVGRLEGFSRGEVSGPARPRKPRPAPPPRRPLPHPPPPPHPHPRTTPPL